MVGKRRSNKTKESDLISFELDALKNILLPDIVKEIEIHIKSYFEKYSQSITPQSSTSTQRESSQSTESNDNPVSSIDNVHNLELGEEIETIQNIETINTAVVPPNRASNDGNLLWNEKYMTPPKFSGFKDDDVYDYICDMHEFFNKLGITLEATKRKYIKQSIDKESPAGQLLYIEECDKMSSEQIFALFQTTFGIPMETNKQGRMKELANLKPLHNDTPMSYLVKIMYLLRKINHQKSRETLFSDAKPYMIKELSSSKADKIIASSNYSEGVQLLKKMEFNDDVEQVNWIKSPQQKPRNTNMRKLNYVQFNRYRNSNAGFDGNRQISSGCYKCGNKSHKALNCNQKKCFICKKDGHDEKSCFFNPNKNIVISTALNCMIIQNAGCKTDFTIAM